MIVLARSRRTQQPRAVLLTPKVDMVATVRTNQAWPQDLSRRRSAQAVPEARNKMRQGKLRSRRVRLRLRVSERAMFVSFVSLTWCHYSICSFYRGKVFNFDIGSQVRELSPLRRGEFLYLFPPSPPFKPTAKKRSADWPLAGQSAERFCNVESARWQLLAAMILEPPSEGLVSSP